MAASLNLFLPLIALGWSSGHEACNVAVGGAAVGGGAVIDHDPSPAAAVDPADCESSDPAGDLEDRGLIEDGVGKLDIELTPAAVLNNGALRQLSPRTSRSLRAKASGWPAYP